ncbi:glycoside hydrolase family protein [Methanocalculus sp. MC3]
MKIHIITVGILALVLLAAGCTTGPEDSAPVSTTSPPQTAAILAEKPETTTTEEKTGQPEENGEPLRFTWTVDSGVRLNDASIPYLYRLEDGRVRMYYNGAAGILSAISDDGMIFEREAGVRLSPGIGGSPEMTVGDPTIVKQKDGTLRMYYKGATGSGGPGQAVHSIFSAISNDGLYFEREGIRIDSQNTPDRGWASVPEAVLLPDGRVRIYYVSDGEDVRHGIVSAISDDGHLFTREGPVLAGFVDPAITILPDGTYLLIASAFPFYQGGRLNDASPGIYSFTSKDGITFTDRSVILSGEGNIDPTIISLGNGNYRIFYWNINDRPSVIRSSSGTLI